MRIFWPFALQGIDRDPQSGKLGYCIVQNSFKSYSNGLAEPKAMQIIMAILAEIEPPSQSGAGKTKQALFVAKIKNHLYKIPKSFLAFALPFFGQAKRRLNFVKIFSSSAERAKGKSLQNRVGQVRNFIISAKYFPHITIGMLAGIVIISNLNERVAAKDLYNQLVYVNPTSENEIAASLDRYTPIILNDASVVQKSALALNISDGFSEGSSPVVTEITAPEVANPEIDNNGKTIHYVVQNGDTLTGIGWRFDVKLATLQYVNKISNADGIKPGTSLEVPPKGYEVAPTLIAKWQNETKNKLALANGRSTVTRNASSGRVRSTGEAGGYIGVINGVKYVRRANRNEDQCYTFVTSQGYQVGGHLLAKWIPTNANSPKVGGLVVTYESWAGHVAIVTGVNGDGTFNIRESNYTHGWITERTLNVRDGDIKGFVN